MDEFIAFSYSCEASCIQSCSYGLDQTGTQQQPWVCDLPPILREIYFFQIWQEALLQKSSWLQRLRDLLNIPLIEDAHLQHLLPIVVPGAKQGRRFLEKHQWIEWKWTPGDDFNLRLCLMCKNQRKGRRRNDHCKVRNEIFILLINWIEVTLFNCHKKYLEGPKFVVAVSAHRNTHTYTHSKILITFSQLSPLEQSCLCGRCSPRWVSLGLAVEATRVSIIVAAPNPVKTH